MCLCLINVEKLKSFRLKTDDQKNFEIEIGGYRYQFNFVIHEIKLDTVKVKGNPRKLTVRWDAETEF